MKHQNLKYLAQKLLKLKKFLVFNDAIVQGRSSIQVPRMSVKVPGNRLVCRSFFNNLICLPL